MSDSEDTAANIDKTFIVEKAKQGRAYCKKCKEKCQQGELRLGKLVPNPYGPGKMKAWHHPACLFELFHKQRQTTKRIESADDMDGFDQLAEDDRKRIAHMIRQSNKAFEDKFGSGGGGGVKRRVKSPIASTSAAVTAVAPCDTGYTINHPPMDNTLDEFHQIIDAIANETKSQAKSNVVAKLFKNESFKGNHALWCRLLLPECNTRVYSLSNKQIIKFFSKIFAVSQDKMLRYFDKSENQDIGDTIATFFEKTTQTQYAPLKKSILTLQDVDDFLDELSSLSKEDDQRQLFKKLVHKYCTVRDLKTIIRLIKMDLRINLELEDVLNGIHENAFKLFQKYLDMEAVVNACAKWEPKTDTKNPTTDVVSRSAVLPVKDIKPVDPPNDDLIVSAKKNSNKKVIETSSSSKKTTKIKRNHLDSDVDNVLSSTKQHVKRGGAIADNISKCKKDEKAMKRKSSLVDLDDPTMISISTTSENIVADTSTLTKQRTIVEDLPKSVSKNGKQHHNRKDEKTTKRKLSTHDDKREKIVTSSSSSTKHASSDASKIVKYKKDHNEKTMLNRSKFHDDKSSSDGIVSDASSSSSSKPLIHLKHTVVEELPPSKTKQRIKKDEKSNNSSIGTKRKLIEDGKSEVELFMPDTASSPPTKRPPLSTEEPSPLPKNEGKKSNRKDKDKTKSIKRKLHEDDKNNAVTTKQNLLKSDNGGKNRKDELVKTIKRSKNDEPEAPKSSKKLTDESNEGKDIENDIQTKDKSHPDPSDKGESIEPQIIDQKIVAIESPKDQIEKDIQSQPPQYFTGMKLLLENGADKLWFGWIEEFEKCGGIVVSATDCMTATHILRLKETVDDYRAIKCPKMARHIIVEWIVDTIEKESLQDIRPYTVRWISNYKEKL